MKRWIDGWNLPCLREALRMMGKRRALFLFAVLLLCAVELVGIPLGTYGIRGIVNAVSRGNRALFLISLALLTSGYLLWWLAAPVSSYLCAAASKKSVRDSKTALFYHILRLPEEALDGKPKGELLSALSNDAACLQKIYDGDFFQVLRSALQGIGGLVMMVYIDWRFAAVVFSLGMASVFISGCFSRKLGRAGAVIQHRLAETGTDVYELIREAKGIRLLRLEEWMSGRFAARAQAESEAREAGGMAKAAMDASVTAIGALSAILVLGVGALFVCFGLSDWGTVVALYGLKYAADCLFSECGRFMADMQKDLAGVGRLLALLKEEEEPQRLPENSGFALGQSAETALRFENVDFSYPGGGPVLTRFSLAVPARGLTALVGESGCGKSTVLRLALALYRPGGGSIVYGTGDADNSALSLDSLRRQTAYVPQEPMLFRGSVFENIACGVSASGEDGCTLARVRAAASLAGADAFVMAMEKGYETVLTDGGGNLSGGQRQRLALARALAGDAPILLLDEITSALDHETEREILSTVREIARTRAVLLVTHKPDIGLIADRVCRL